MSGIEAKSCGDFFEQIPRILHQTWKTREIPVVWESFRQSWLEHNPDWEHRIWTDSDIEQLVLEKYPDFLPTFRAFPRNIQRVDAAKIMILKEHGGLYADLDTECLQSVDALLEDGGMLLSKTSDGVIEGAFIAAPPAHPFCSQVLERMQSQRLSARIFTRLPGLQATGVLLSTGPLMLHREQKEYFKTSGPAKSAGLRVLNPRYCSGRSWWRRNEAFKPEPETYVLHHHSDSWLLPLEQAVVRFAHPAGISLIILAVLLVAFGWQMIGGSQ